VIKDADDLALDVLALDDLALDDSALNELLLNTMALDNLALGLPLSLRALPFSSSRRPALTCWFTRDLF
jgi:hypothetical protein